MTPRRLRNSASLLPSLVSAARLSMSQSEIRKGRRTMNPLAQPPSTNTVQFFFGSGSRYSYLAASQLPKLAEETGAHFRWRAVYSPELIRRAGADPFAPNARRGQYQDQYRTQDAMRWAAYYGIPYSEPDWHAVDWRQLALACVAADLRNRGDVFARCLFEACFAGGTPPKGGEAELAAIAERAGLPGADLIKMLHDPIVNDRHDRNIRDALDLVVFGVPTFVTQDGELFFGQDRIPLLRRHLLQARLR
jgi:2-hydroxychromene-2-carboxylate isomerase